MGFKCSLSWFSVYFLLQILKEVSEKKESGHFGIVTSGVSFHSGWVITDEALVQVELC